MTLSFLTLSLAFVLCQQDPQPRSLDVVELKNGDEIEGRITTQLDGYLEVELHAGATVGLSMAQVRAIRRGAGAPVRADRGPIEPRSEWFVLYDGAGESVGWLQAGVSIAADGGVTISEEYEFLQGQRRYQVTTLCKATTDFVPQSCYFRERVSEPVLGVSLVPGEQHGQAERIVDERIVEGTCGADRLLVQQLDRSGRRERELPWSSQHTFPLLARAVARHSGAALAATTMYDPTNDEVVVRTIAAARPRRVTWDGKPLVVTEFAETSSSGRNSVWLDASASTLRRELAGPALVAVRSEGDSARRMAGGVSIPSSFVIEPEGSFACWRPNPCWSAVEEMAPGSIVLAGPVVSASISVVRLGHLEPGAPLAAAADAVNNWFLLLHPDLRFESREAAMVKGRTAVRMQATGKHRRARVEVVPQGETFLVVVCLAGREVWEELQPDFEFVVGSLELDPEAVAPRLQGPVKARTERAEGKAANAPANKPAAAPPRKLPLVRVPDDG